MTDKIQLSHLILQYLELKDQDVNFSIAKAKEVSQTQYQKLLQAYIIFIYEFMTKHIDPSKEKLPKVINIEHLIYGRLLYKAEIERLDNGTYIIRDRS